MPVDVLPDPWQKVKAALWSEEDLLKGAFRNHPFLSKSTNKFECEHTHLALDACGWARTPRFPPWLTRASLACACLFADGYRLKEFPDDPVKIADPKASEPSSNPLVNWFNSLDSGLNDGSGWGNPLNRN